MKAENSNRIPDSIQQLDCELGFGRIDQMDSSELKTTLLKYRAAAACAVTELNTSERKRTDLKADVSRLNRNLKEAKESIEADKEEIRKLQEDLDNAMECLRLHNVQFVCSSSEKGITSSVQADPANQKTNDEKSSSEKPEENSSEEIKTREPRSTKGKASKAGISKTKLLENSDLITEEEEHLFDEDFLKEHPDYVVDEKMEELVQIEWREGHFASVHHKVQTAHRKKTMHKCLNDLQEEDRHGEDKNLPALIQADPSVIPLFERSSCGFSLMAHIIVQKFDLYLPYERICRYFQEHNLFLTKQTVNEWIKKACWILRPLYWTAKEGIRSCNYLQGDETTALCLEEKQKHSRENSYFAQMLSGPRELEQIQYYEFIISRVQVFITKILDKNRHYCFQSDGYSGYTGWDFILNFGCHDHARRPFVEALESMADYPKYKAILEEDGLNSRKMQSFLNAPGHEKMKDCVYIIDTYSVIYHNEAAFKADHLTADEIKDKRTELIRPLLDQIYETVLKYTSKLDPRTNKPVGGNIYVPRESKLGKGITYFKNQKDSLYRLLEDGNLELSNIRCERGMKPLKLIERNSMFYDTVQGAKNSAILLTLTETCRLNHVRIEAWFEYALKQLRLLDLSSCLTSLKELDQTTQKKLHDLMPYSKVLPEELYQKSIEERIKERMESTSEPAV